MVKKATQNKIGKFTKPDIRKLCSSLSISSIEGHIKIISFCTMAKNAHLTLDERVHIEVSLREGDTFTEIGRELGKDPSTISKEVKNHSHPVRKGSYNPCAKRTSCSYMGKACKPCKHPYHGSCKGCSYRKCYEHCPDFVELNCL